MILIPHFYLTAHESGVDSNVTSRFPGAHLTYGPGASGSGDNRAIMLDEGGGLDPQTGRYDIFFFEAGFDWV